MRSRSSPIWDSSPLILSSSRRMSLPKPAIAGQDQPTQGRSHRQHRNQDAGAWGEASRIAFTGPSRPPKIPHLCALVGTASLFVHAQVLDDEFVQVH